MSYDFGGFKKTSEATLDWLRREYLGLRTGQATPTILDSVMVESYGSKVPVKQVASITTSGPKSLLIAPWDKAVAAEIDKSIREANLGLSVATDSQGIRVSFPDLTAERRNILTKTLKEKLEEARIKIRVEREKILSGLDKKEKDGTLNKDDKFRLRNELQKLVDDANKKLEELSTKKEKEILA